MVEVAPFGEVEGRTVEAITLRRGPFRMVLSQYGARLVEFWAPGRDGHVDDVVLGFEDAAGYEQHTAYFGATVGRYGNRIRDGRFHLDGRCHELTRNESGHHLHGGQHGFDRRMWEHRIDEAAGAVVFSLHSPDGDQGYPGAVDAVVRYQLDATGRLSITMSATTDRPTIVNLVHHSYWNLAGHASGDILGHRLRIAADHYLPVTEELLPTGEVLSVAGTPFDLRRPTVVGDRVEEVVLAAADGAPGGVRGFDHNWVLGRADDVPEGQVEAVDPGSGRRLRLWSSEPGAQLYTGNYLEGDLVGKGGTVYRRYAGFALETQKFPDSPNFRHFPSAQVLPDQLYRHEMVLAFDTVGS